MLLDRLGDRAEDDALLLEGLAEGGLHRHRVHHSVHSHTRQGHLLLERNTQLVEGALELGIDLVHRAQLLLGLRGGVVDHLLKINLGDVEVRPRGVLERQPIAVGLQTLLGHPVRFTLLFGNEAHHGLRETLFDQVGLDIGREAVLILLTHKVLQYLFFVFLCHSNFVVDTLSCKYSENFIA